MSTETDRIRTTRCSQRVTCLSPFLHASCVDQVRNIGWFKKMTDKFLFEVMSRVNSLTSYLHIVHLFIIVSFISTLGGVFGLVAIILAMFSERSYACGDLSAARNRGIFSRNASSIGWFRHRQWPCSRSNELCKT